MRYVPAIGEFSVTLPSGDTLQLREAPQSELLKRLYWQNFDGYEPSTAALFCRLAKRSKVILDVGAYVFYYGLLAAKTNPDASVFCFEPVVESLRLGERLAELNGLTNLVGINSAVGKSDGSATFFLPDRSHSQLPNIGSLKNRFQPGQTFADRGARAVRIEVVTIDGFVEKNGLPVVDLLKIDTEETEGEVLRGAEQTIKRFKPTIILEIIPSNNDASNVMFWLQARGYRFYSTDGLRELSTASQVIGNAQRRGNYGEVLCTTENDVTALVS